MNEPRWRTALNWSAVIMFFTMPLIIFVLHLIALERHGEFAEHIHEFSWLGPVYTTVSALVFGLAGLNTLDRHVIGERQLPPVKAVSAEQPKSKRSD